MAALPIALAGAGAAAGAAAAGAAAGLVQPVMDLTKSAVKFVADVSEKIGEEKRHHFHCSIHIVFLSLPSNPSLK
jgi:hypothetical protein